MFRKNLLGFLTEIFGFYSNSSAIYRHLAFIVFEKMINERILKPDFFVPLNLTFYGELKS
jgi:hypothetical protein